MTNEQSLFVQADSEKCSGCRACELACFAQHAYAGAKSNKAKTVGMTTAPVLPNLFVIKTKDVSMPVQCHHCEDAPCLKACLPGAIRRVNNVVCVDARRCIGCRNCALACPFGAIEVISASLVETITAEFGKETLQTSDGAVKFVHKCDLCLESSSGPACVNVCPNKALRIVNTAVEIAQKRINALEAAPQNENFKECLKGGSL